MPLAELWIRAVAQEIQRLYNHTRQIARVAEAASQNVGQAQMAALSEEMLRLAGRLFGHRWLFGALLPGGPPRRLDLADRRFAADRLRDFGRGFDDLWALFLGSRTFLDRVQTTATVPRAAAIRFGAVGPTLRAAGVPWDDRLRTPTPPYDDLFLALPQETEGDGLARLLVRAGEVRSSLLLLDQLLDRWDRVRAEEVAPAPAVGPDRGLARTEAPSGDLVYDVRLAGGRVAAVGMRTPSQAHWPLLALGCGAASSRTSISRSRRSASP
ncbi:NADH-quinone oxidoreductase, subunit D domain protein, partial [mine drainage metagenome]